MFPISECLTEKNIYYGGNEYTVALPRAETVESCRSACKYEGTDYFSFDTIMESCDCKSSTAGRKEDSHFVSGETSCTASAGEMNLKRRAFQVTIRLYSKTYIDNESFFFRNKRLGEEDRCGQGIWWLLG